MPLLLGGLGDFVARYQKREGMKNYIYVNEALQKLAKTLPECRFVSAEGLTENPEIVHFNAVSLREFGLRYYEKFKELESNS